MEVPRIICIGSGIHDRGISWTGNTDSKGGVPVLLGKEGTFKWSRENGSILFPILNLEKGSAVVSLAHWARDARLSSFARGLGGNYG